MRLGPPTFAPSGSGQEGKVATAHVPRSLQMLICHDLGARAPAPAACLRASPSSSSSVSSSRRAFGLGVLSVLSLPAVPRPANAVVDGIPLYAPNSGTALPDQGFETLLPKTEAILDSMTALRAAAEQGDWAAVSKMESAATLEAQLACLGSMASILGDEAYT